MKLELRSADKKLLSDNLYWLAPDSPTYRQLNHLPAVTLSATATSTRVDQSTRIHVQLKNPGASPALAAKLTLLSASDSSRILPAYLSDNYVSLLPGETREIDIEYPNSAASGQPQIALRGWNISPGIVSVIPK